MDQDYLLQLAQDGSLYQKYRKDAFGERGEGGEYVVQTGFGCTNGLALHYLSICGQQYRVGSADMITLLIHHVSTFSKLSLLSIK